MPVLLTGASGFLGAAVTPKLAAAGLTVVPLRRRTAVPAPGEAVWDTAADQIQLSHSGPLDAVVHLAGASIGRRWSPAIKQQVWDSRCRGTEILCAALTRLPAPPRVLVCASAIGYYGNRGEEQLDEQSAPGSGFLAELVQAWERATASAVTHGIRVVHLRFGIVLAPHGGALARMLPVFRAGLGGRLGHGRQFWSWITLDDCVRVVLHALSDETLRGPVNVVSPQPVTNAEFTRGLAAVLRRPAILAVPHFIVELAFGEMGRETLLASTRVAPTRLQQAGFFFQHAELNGALRALLSSRP